MSSEKTDLGPLLRSRLRTAAVGLLILLALLVLSAFLISGGHLPEGKEKYIIPAAALLSGAAARKLTDADRGGGALPGALLGGAFFLLYLVILSVMMRDIHPDLRSLGMASAVYALGDLLGSVVSINKKGRRKHYQRQKYNR